MRMNPFIHKQSKRSRRLVVTTSWDDDAVSGMKVSGLLSDRGLPGTFYVPTGQLGKDLRFTNDDLRALASNGFEIGAHTVSHRVLTDLNPAERMAEIKESKLILEQILGREVTTFCYPRGRFNAEVAGEVERAGYLGARTTRMLCRSAVFPPFEMPTTIQAYPHRPSNYARNLIRLAGLPAVLNAAPDLILFQDWLSLGKKMFQRALRAGGVWHLYGHPWEIEKLNLWAQLQDLLDFVSHREGVIYLTNAELLQFVNSENEVSAAQPVSIGERSSIR